MLRIANKEGYSPREVEQVSASIRKILGSRESASHFRVGTDAIEFNIFADNEKELAERKRLLTESSFRIVSVRLLDTPPKAVDKAEALEEGIQLFNAERFWVSQEALDHVWHVE